MRDPGESGPGGVVPPGSFRLKAAQWARERSTWIYLASISLLAVAVRLLPWRASISPWHVLFIQPDAYYHLRRATIIARNFPVYPTIDTYMAYPFGAEPPWPPLYDYFLAVASLVAGLGDPSERTFQLVAAFLPPILAGLSVIPVFLLTREIFGKRAALVAAFFAVMMPGQLGYSAVGSGDHHVAEVLFFALQFYFLLKAMRLTAPERFPGSPEAEPERFVTPFPLRESALAGVSLGAATLIWQGSLVFATLGVLVLAVALLREPERARRSALLRVGAVHLAIAALLTGLARAAIPPATSQTVFSFGFFSWFQPFYLLFLAGAIGILHGAIGLARKRGTGAGRLLAWAGLALALAAVSAAVPPIRRNLLQALEFVLRDHPYLRSISEFGPLIDRNPWHGAFDIPFLFDILYLFGFFLPLLLAARILWVKRGKGLSDGEWAFVLWTALFGALTLEQKRWSNVYSANMAAAIGSFVVGSMDRSRVGQRILSDFREWRQETGRSEAAGRQGVLPRLVLYSRRFPVVLAIAAAVFFFIPYYLTVFSMAFPRSLAINPDMYNSMVWIRHNTPPTKNPWRPVERPEYAILASWDLGHWIQYIAERPTVANNFGYQLRGEGLEDSVRMYLHEKEKDLVDLCDRRGVRYLLLTDVFAGMPSMAPIIGVNFERDFISAAVPPGHPGGAMVVPNDRYLALPSQRMYLFDGSATPEGEAIERFRLVFESKYDNGMPYLPPGVKVVKLFEKVKGARIRGKATPGLPVSVSVRMATNFDRVFDFVALTEAGTDGAFGVTVPYASQGTAYPVRAVSPYLAMTEKEAVFFNVPEKDIIEGAEVRVDLRKSGLPGRQHPGIRSPRGPDGGPEGG